MFLLTDIGSIPFAGKADNLWELSGPMWTTNAAAKFQKHLLAHGVSLIGERCHLEQLR